MSSIRAAISLAAILSTGLAWAAPAGGAGPEQTTVQNGSWSDPAVWDLGIVPVDATDGSIAYIQHLIGFDTSGGVSFAFVGTGGRARQPHPEWR
jgi:hypothetical protein